MPDRKRGAFASGINIDLGPQQTLYTETSWLYVIITHSRFFFCSILYAPLRGMGGHGFDPRPRHTKVVKNGTSCSSLGTQNYGVELGLVDPVSG